MSALTGMVPRIKFFYWYVINGSKIIRINQRTQRTLATVTHTYTKNYLITLLNQAKIYNFGGNKRRTYGRSRKKLSKILIIMILLQKQLIMVRVWV